MAAWLTRGFWTLSTVYAALVVWAASVLPDRVPAHWGTSGPPDRWGNRAEAIIMLVVLGVVMVGLFGSLIVFVPRSRSLTWINVPGKWYWQRPENLPRAMQMVAVDMAVIGCLSMAFCCVVPVMIVQASQTPDAALPSWSTAAFIAFIALIIGYSVWMVAGRWRVPPDASPR